MFKTQVEPRAAGEWFHCKVLALFQLEIQRRGTEAHYNDFIPKAVFHNGVSENIICFSGGSNILLQ